MQCACDTSDKENIHVCPTHARIAELEAALGRAQAALINAGSSLKIQADALKDAGFEAYKIRDK